jgi:Fibronectin type III domain
MRWRLVKSLMWIGALVIFQLIFTQHARAAAPPTYPTAPESVTVTPGPASLNVAWSSPTNVDTGILNYRVEYSLDGNSWTTASSTVPASTYSYSITNLSVNTNYYVRVAAQVTSGLGPYGYPWTKLYGTTDAKRDGNNLIIYQSGYGIGGSDTGTVLASASFTRVRYKASSNNLGSTIWADMNFLKWGFRADSAFNTPAANVSYLRIPTTGGSEQFVIKTNVSDLTVNSSLSSLITFGHQGRLEIWPYNYTQSHTNLTPYGNDSLYDFDDSPAMNSNFGSFQVFDLTDTHTIFAWNIDPPGKPDVGFGNGTGANPILIMALMRFLLRSLQTFQHQQVFRASEQSR